MEQELSVRAESSGAESKNKLRVSRGTEAKCQRINQSRRSEMELRIKAGSQNLKGNKNWSRRRFRNGAGARTRSRLEAGEEQVQQQAWYILSSHCSAVGARLISQIADPAAIGCCGYSISSKAAQLGLLIA